MRYNAVNFTFDDNVVLTKVGFFTSNAGDLLYDLFILEVKSITQINTYFNGKLKLDLRPSTDKEVMVSRERVSDFKDWMGR